MQVRWTLKAASQLEDIADYIAERNPIAAHTITAKIVERIEQQLPAHPYSGRAGEHYPDTRELVIPGTFFIVVYRVRADVVEILRVRHTSMQWPPPEDDDLL